MNIFKRPILRILIPLESLLLIPLFAMQISSEVNWSSFDFILMAFLLFSLSVLIELAISFTKRGKWRAIAIVFAIVSFLLIWAELAVGLIGSPFAGS